MAIPSFCQQPDRVALLVVARVSTAPRSRRIIHVEPIFGLRSMAEVAVPRKV